MFRLGKLLSNQLGVRMLPARGLELGSHSARAERLQLRGNMTRYVRKPNEILRFALDDRVGS
ncbi:hypothetical protein QE390_000066 [Siphonobacter sp. SORGH_AS 1065]|nr:hypothetical protein [Siphonobacter sp. SORGH_AS_1065]